MSYSGITQEYISFCELPTLIMHEYSITQYILEVILDSVKNENIKQITKATIEVGAFSHVYFDQVTYWWEILAEGTILEKTKLEKINIPGKVICKDCETITIIDSYGFEEIDIQINIFQCKNCKSTNTEIIQGRDVRIGNLEVISEAHS